MKKGFTLIVGLSFVCIALVFQGCNKLKTLVQYDLNYTTVKAPFTLSQIPDTLQHGGIATTSPVNINIDSFIKASTNNLFGVSNIQHAYITSCTLTLSNADSSDNFANLKSCSASFSTDIHTASVAIGTITNNPDVYSQSLTLPTDSTDFASYLNASTVTYAVGGQARRITNKSLNGTVTLVLKIHVQG